MIRIIIVEDEPAIARGLCRMITDNYPDFSVIALLRNGKEGLSKALETSPDLIFTDVNMPVMNGLEMISQIRQCGLSTRFVILTGYAEFEYARTALQLGVSDYLLKPISPDILDGIIQSHRQRAKAELRILQSEYLQRCLEKAPLQEKSANPLIGYHCVLLLFLAGPIRGNVYNQFINESHSLQLSLQDLHSIEEEENIFLLPLRCKHYNEYLCALIYPCLQNKAIEVLIEKLYKKLLSDTTYLNLFFSLPNSEDSSIHLHSKELYLYALFNIPFGFGGIHSAKPLTNNKISVSPEIKRICLSLPKNPSPDILNDFLHSMFVLWKKNKVSQFQLTVDLRYFINTVVYYCNIDSMIIPEASEIISSYASYAELESGLQYELKCIHDLGGKSLPQNQQTLARQVRNWLILNFTTPISYKTLKEEFGHNEKYISALFKAEFGISPSKYITELRMNMAKKLMQSNPDILLKDIAEMVGFTDVFYFSRVFKLYEGISPSLYAKNQKKDTP